MHFIYKIHLIKVIDNDTVFYEHFTINIMLSFDDLTILQFALIVMHCRFLQCSIDFKKKETLRRTDTLFLFLIIKSI